MFYRELNNKITTLKGVGPAVASSYKDAQIKTWAELLQLSPRDFEDRSQIINLNDIPRDSEETVHINTIVRVISHTFFGGFSAKGKTLKIIVEDETCHKSLSLMCFGRNFLANTIKINQLYYLYGSAAIHYNEYQSSQFELKPLETLDSKLPLPFGQYIPIYPLRGSLTQKIIHRDIDYILKNTPTFEDELPLYIREELSLISTDTAIRMYHQPSSREIWELSRKTLAITELFYMQVIARRNMFTTEIDYIRKPSICTNKENELIASLPFSLTNDQMKVLKEIRDDLDCPITMNRLLQGDVSSGKTLIAWISALHVISKGFQVVFMAPTELLATQHSQNAKELLESLNIKTVLLTGSVSKKNRTIILKEIANGKIDIIIGTHAVFSSDVKFKSLKYVIIDEQHRFGVAQREALLSKGNNPDILLMSATPIPRSLALTVFGDLHISTIREKPVNRKEITSYLVSEQSRERMYRSISVEFERGHQAYFVYPRIDDSGPRELRDVTNMFIKLQEEYPGVPSALLHSKIPDDAKIDILRKFKNKELSYLVSTSVIEVGIDVPNATCMIIEHADIFGLSALHQLRGRVGRSALQSFCFFVYGDNISDLAKERLRALKESTDGFVLSEKDLSLRGPGDINGTKQSGYLKLHFSSFINDTDYILIARKYCDKILSTDSKLELSKNKIIDKVLKEANPFPNEED
ncbi:MAG: ATP-dependent DNA helicase RecG [Spirochaetaceae bacterium]|nr:ATP-dependent DNA helicase RecG [Spirochaetaceae bacterium]